MTIPAVVIIGANGFIGSHLCNYLSTKNYNVVAAMRPNTLNGNGGHVAKSVRLIELFSAEFSEFLDQYQPEYLIHSAGSSSVEYSFANSDEDFQKNVLLTETVFSYLKKYSPRTKVIFLSSAAVYGNAAQLPITEKTATNPISPYGHHKLISEQIVKKYYKLFGIQSIILRIFSVYGPGLRKQILWDVYQKSLKEALLVFYGSGTETRNFIYIDDLVKLVDILLEKAIFDAKIINVTSGESVSISYLIKTMLNNLNCDKPYQFNSTVKSGDPEHLIGSCEQVILKAFTWTSIEQGIKAYIEWLNTKGQAL